VRSFACIRDSGLYGFENLLITGTAAEDAGQGVADLGACGMRMFIQQRLCGDEKAWSAIAALSGAEIGECLLKRMELAVGSKAFHGRHLALVTLDPQHEAREDRLPVQQDRARAAFAELASVLRAAEIQIFTKDLEQRLVRREVNFARLAVDGQDDARLVSWFHEQLLPLDGTGNGS